MTKMFSVVALLWRNGKVLAVPRKTDPNDLGLPGGKIDPGESEVAAVIRELQEETGLSTTPSDVTAIFDHLDRVVGGELQPCRCFLVTKWEGTLTGVEGPMPVWVPPGRLLEESCSFRDYNRALFDARLEDSVQVLASRARHIALSGV